ncbi:hypothetical protein ACWEO4_47725, partial [Streptomyces sp. NPDC004393]
MTAFAEVGADVVYTQFPPDLDALVAIVTAVAPTRAPSSSVIAWRVGDQPVGADSRAGTGVRDHC